MEGDFSKLDMWYLLTSPMRGITRWCQSMVATQLSSAAHSALFSDTRHFMWKTGFRSTFLFWTIKLNPRDYGFTIEEQLQPIVLDLTKAENAGFSMASCNLT
ncbi:hypothetical protein V6N12_004896 [Hibiscus sabdariffa]|uniref:Uncharacterized protein n=1 Tax=Hibiscus sabdariffa TaxID=183260 RepID=A0ABR2CMX1_9ROSI